MYTLKDIAGYEQEKEKLKEIIEMFKNYHQYKKKGVTLSKGLILSGQPGVGKTLFARVLANEINAPFYYLDGSKMSGVFGIYKINKMFKKAYKNAPAVIFIDELNSFIGDDFYETDTTQKNLSALLKLIDGIEKKEGVFVIGATSDKETLDRAILRSGRMDKHICISNPNYESRKAIFNYYLEKVEVEKQILNINEIIKSTNDFTPADIKTLVNEAALEALYLEEELTDEILLSSMRKIKNQDIERLVSDDFSYYAYHDLAHMIVSKTLTSKYDSISIKYDDMLLGNSSIKYMIEEDDDDEDEYQLNNDFVKSLSKEDILNYITILLAPKALEEIKYKTNYMKSKDDIAYAIKLLYQAFDAGLFGFAYTTVYHYAYDFKFSHDNMKKVEDAKTEILEKQYTLALEIIKNNLDVIEKLYKKLIETKSLSKMEIEQILKNNDKY